MDAEKLERLKKNSYPPQDNLTDEHYKELCDDMDKLDLNEIGFWIKGAAIHDKYLKYRKEDFKFTPTVTTL